MSTSYILVLIGAVLCLMASGYVKTTYGKYSIVHIKSGMTGVEAAQRILNANGIYDVEVRHCSGQLTDHYDPKNKTVNLSDSVYAHSSVAAVSVAAHECGHVIQHYREYAPIKIRASLVPIANFGSKLGLPMVVIGLAIGGGIRSIGLVNSASSLNIGNSIAVAGVALFSLAVLFQLVTLPVEFNASSRALKELCDEDILTEEEIPAGRKVLKAAAYTYVAAAASSILQLLRLISILGGGKRKR